MKHGVDCHQEEVVKSNIYLSNIKALNGLSAVSLGEGIRSTIALRISVIPIPSYKREGTQKNIYINYLLQFSLKYRCVQQNDKIIKTDLSRTAYGIATI
jgi:hypothetical protein